MDAMRSYRHGNLRCAIGRRPGEFGRKRVAGGWTARAARRVGVSATAAYRHFTNKEDLLASVAAQGFHELAEAMQNGTQAHSPHPGGSCLYEFADQNRGLFRLMFGPVLAERSKYPALQAASAGVEAMLVRGVADIDPRPLNDNQAAMAAWGLVHGLAHLIVDGFFPAARATVQAEEILAKVRLPRPEALGPAGYSRNRLAASYLSSRWVHCEEMSAGAARGVSGSFAAPQPRRRTRGRSSSLCARPICFRPGLSRRARASLTPDAVTRSPVVIQFAARVDDQPSKSREPECHHCPS